MLGGFSIATGFSWDVAAASNPALEDKAGYHLVVEHVLTTCVDTAGELDATVVEDSLKILFLRRLVEHCF